MPNTELELTTPIEINPPHETTSAAIGPTSVTPILTRLCPQPLAHLDFAETVYAKPLLI
jgi:hypothetical protein